MKQNVRAAYNGFMYNLFLGLISRPAFSSPLFKQTMHHLVNFTGPIAVYDGMKSLYAKAVKEAAKEVEAEKRTKD